MRVRAGPWAILTSRRDSEEGRGAPRDPSEGRKEASFAGDEKLPR